MGECEAAGVYTTISCFIEKHQNYQGNFQQVLVDDRGEVIQESSGHFIVQKPGYFHWETKTPFPQLLMSNRQTLWLYDPDLEQVTVRSYEASVDDSPAVLFSADASKIYASYFVERINKSTID